MNPFDDAPEFLELDNRRQRSFSPVSKEQMRSKHEALLPASLLAGKTVLDLGSCLGATGHWCLSCGAISYRGVEAQKEYAALARSLLRKYHPGKAEVDHAPIETWLADAKGAYDIVCLLGVLYVFTDYYSILRRASELAREFVVIEGLYPDRSIFGDDFCGVEFLGSQRINLAAENASLTGRGARLSPKGLQFIMQDFGFGSREGILMPSPIKGSVDVFNAPKTPGNVRYLMRFERIEEKAQSLSEDLRGAKTGKKIVW